MVLATLFHAEIDKATERLESVQKHVMLQVSEAREALKRTESQLAKVNQKNEQLSVEVQEYKAQLGTMTHIKNRTHADLEKLAGEAAQLRVERDSFMQQLASASAKLTVQAERLASLDRHATGASKPNEEALKRQTRNRKSGNKN